MKKLFSLGLMAVMLVSCDKDKNTDSEPEKVVPVAVDLGLPSGTLWANMNVGAEKPEESGLFFAWGETTGYKSDLTDGRIFDWANYKWADGSQEKLTKYYPSTETKYFLDSEDDAATANWGGEWSMPTAQELKELLENTTNEWTTENGVYGRKFTAKNGNSIFLPATGDRKNEKFESEGSYGYYWPKDFNPDNAVGALGLGFSDKFVSPYPGERCYGHTVRPVKRNYTPENPKLSRNASIYGTAPESVELVDLGLPSGTLWANMNLGAEKPEDSGLFFAWGETTGYKEGHDFSWSSYKFGEENTLTKYCTMASNGTVDNKMALVIEDDAARANWGGQWSIPSLDERNELIANTTYEWTEQNGVKGMKYTSKINGKSIFLPAAGYYKDGELTQAGEYGGYWAAAIKDATTIKMNDVVKNQPPQPHMGCYIVFSNTNGNAYSSGHNVFRCYGQSIRPVVSKVPTGYVDLGVSVYWAKNDYDENGKITFLVSQAGNITDLPTTAMYQELFDKCYWVKASNGYNVFKSVDPTKDHGTTKESDHEYKVESDSYIFFQGMWGSEQYGYYGRYLDKIDDTFLCLYFGPNDIFPGHSVVLDDSKNVEYSVRQVLNK